MGPASVQCTLYSFIFTLTSSGAQSCSFNFNMDVETEFMIAIRNKDFDKALAIKDKQSFKTIDEMLLPRLRTALFDAIGNVQLLFTL